jgi:ADP-ribosyl-[dinitrogen reductase] hydrolase
MTICPGKHERGAAFGDWERDLRTDVKAIAEWGACAVVSLLQEDELRRLNIAAMGDIVERAGMDWHLLPIQDTAVPESDFEDLWFYSGHVLRTALLAGKKILIHCKGGLGRTGTIAARLMVELGERPADAIDKVREARPNTIENTAQERHVLSTKRLHIPDQLLDRILACLLGGAVGDAFGYAVEFLSWRQIENHFGPRGIQAPVIEDGQIRVSDDTQMTLFTLEALVNSKEELKRQDFDAVVERIQSAYLDWSHTQENGPARWEIAGTLAKDPVMRSRMAPGNTCLAALANGGRGTIERAINDSKGCGGVMRIAPIGLISAIDPAAAAGLAARAAALTHGHPSGYLSAAAMAAILRLGLDGCDLAAAGKRAKDLLRAWKGGKETLANVDAALASARNERAGDRKTVSAIGQGWTGEEALGIALYSALVAKSFPDVFKIGANHDGDSDSTASIAGQLYGLFNGMSGLPNEWVRRLNVLKPLLRLSRELFNPRNEAVARPAGHLK